MPTPGVIKGSDHMFITTYEGNGGGQKVGNFVPFTDNATIAKSCIFDSASNVSLTRTPGSAGNRKTFTFSCWVKRGRLGDAAGNNTYGQRIFNAGSSGSSFFDIKFSGSGDTEGANRLHIREYSSSAEKIEYWTNRTFEDTSKWYNIVVQVNTTESTSTDRIKVYVDGDQITSWYRSNAPAQDFDTLVNSTVLHNIGRFTGATSNNLDAYLAEVNFVDGSIVAPSTFGLTDTSTGRWIPKSLTGITYGTNGFRMEFANSAGQTIGDDTSGNTNDYAVSNIATTDIVTDSPTQNFATISPNFSGTLGFAEGNLYISQTQSNDYQTAYVGKSVSSGKWYFEITATTVPTFFLIGLTSLAGYVNAKTTYVGDNAGSYGFQFYPGNNDTLYYDGSNVSYGSESSLSNGNIIGVAYDADTGAYWLAVNNSWIQSGNPTNGTNPLFTFKVGTGNTHRREEVLFGTSTYNGGVFDYNFGQKSLSYTPPTGFSLLQQDNFPDEGVKPDIVWIKNRDATDNHQWYDSSRGPQNRLCTNNTDGEDVVTDGLQKFIKGGVAIEDDDAINTAAESYVSWNWVAGGGTTSANTDGVGATVACTIQKNTTAGISIVEWTGGGSAGTIEHGLGKVPAWMMYKRKSSDGDAWVVYHHKLNSGSPEDGHLSLQTTGSTFSNDATIFNDTAPTTQLATIGSYGMGNTEKRVGYFFAEIPGFSKFGHYVGNANADGPFIYTGFKPSWLLFKSLNGASWYITSDKMFNFNPNSAEFHPDTSAVQTTLAGGRGVDYLSNGFKIRQESGYGYNYSGVTTVYFAFAKHPFIGDGVNPCTAR